MRKCPKNHQVCLKKSACAQACNESKKKSIKWNFYHFSRITVIDGKTSRFSNFSHLIGFNIEKKCPAQKTFYLLLFYWRSQPAVIQTFGLVRIPRSFCTPHTITFSPKYPCHLWIGLLEPKLKRKPCAHEGWSILLLAWSLEILGLWKL